MGYHFSCIFVHYRVRTHKGTWERRLPSRLPMGNDSVFEQYHSQNVIVSMIQESQLTSLPISAEEIKKATDKDHILQKVIGKMKKGWPKLRKNVSKELQPYFDRRFQLTSLSGCLLCGQRVIIPTLLREQMLTEIHEGHTGIVRMKAVARKRMYGGQTLIAKLKVVSTNVMIVKEIQEIQQGPHYIHGSNQKSHGNACT